jgi:hypothetical protein
MGAAVIKGVGRAGDGTPVVLLGLTGENMTRLMADEPIVVDLAEMGLPGMKIVLVGGKDEATMAAELRGCITPLTTIHGTDGDGL